MARIIKKVVTLSIAEKEIADQALAVMGARLQKLTTTQRLEGARGEAFLSAMDPRSPVSGALAYDAVSGKVVLRDVFNHADGVPPNTVTIRVGGVATELKLDREALFRELGNGPHYGGSLEVSYVLGSIDEAAALAAQAHKRWEAAAGRAVNVKNSAFYKKTQDFTEDLSAFFGGE